MVAKVSSVKQRDLTGQANGVHTSPHQGVEEPSCQESERP